MTFYFTLWFLLSSVFPCLFSAVNFHRRRHLYLAGRPHVGHRPTFYLVVKATTMIMIITIASVLWHCWLGIRKSIQPVKKLSDEVQVWLYVESAVQIQTGFTFLVPAYPGHRGTDWLIQLRFLRPTRHKTGHFGDVLQANLGLAWKN